MPSEVDGRSGSSDGTDVGRVRGRLCVVRSETARVMLTFLVGERVEYFRGSADTWKIKLSDCLLTGHYSKLKTSSRSNPVFANVGRPDFRDVLGDSAIFPAHLR